MLSLATRQTASAKVAPTNVVERMKMNGVVRRAGDRQPVGGARVTVAPAHDEAWVRSVEADEDGAYELTVPTAAALRVVVLVPGFERYEATVTPTADGVSGFNPVLVPLADNPYRTVVAARREAQPAVAQRRLDREEIATVPGAQGDALRALQSLPGVARTPGGLGLLVLRGAAPSQSLVMVGEHRVPRAFHGLAIASVVPADALDGVDYAPGNFSSRYGNASGGAVVLAPRRGRRDGVHGYGEIDLGGVGAMVEGPLDAGSFLVAVQRGYVDGALRLVERIDEEQTFVLPRWWDYQAFLDQPVHRGTTLALRLLGAEDRIQNRFNGREGREVAFELVAGFHRIDVELRHTRPRWDLLLSPSFRFERARTEAGSTQSSRLDYVVSWRAEARRRITRRAALTFGTDLEVDPFSVRTTAPIGMFPGADATTTSRTRGVQASIGSYGSAELSMGPTTLFPGVRFAAFTLGQSAAFAVDPRLNGHWDINDAWRLKAGVGLYSEAVTVVETADGNLIDEVTQVSSLPVVLPAAIEAFEPEVALSPVVDQVGVAQALQASTAIAYEPSPTWAIEVGGYARVRADGNGTAFDNDGRAFIASRTQTRNYGLEVFLRRRNTGSLYGWVAYTLSWAQLRPTDDRGGLQDVRTGPFDQRHNLAVVASYNLPKRWRIGGRFRVVSGSPYTPVVGAVDVARPFGSFLERAVPIFGAANSARFPVFHQLDLRVDKRWLARYAAVTLYLDVQNVYNQQNIEAYIYSAGFRDRLSSVGLPIFPSLGLRVDY